MLTDKQEKFVQELIKGKSQREAYKAAYGCEGWKDKSIDERACRLFKNTKVRSRYDELHDVLVKESADDAMAMRAFIISQLKKIASGELCEETSEWDGDGNLIKTKKSVKPSDVKDAMLKLAEFYGVETENKDQTIHVVFDGDDYGI